MHSSTTEEAKLPNLLKTITNPGWAFQRVADAGYGYGRLYFWLALEFALLEPLNLTAGILQLRNSASGGFSQLWSRYLHFALRPGIAVFIAGIILYYLLRKNKKSRLDIYPAASVIAHAWVPHIGWVCLGAILTASQMAHPILPQFSYNTPSLTPGLKILKAILEFGPMCAYGFFAYRSLKSQKTPPIEPPPSTMLNQIITITAIALVLGASAKVSQYAFANWKSVRPIMVRDPLPQFSLPALNGNETLTLSELEGKVVLLDFWATWCTPCVVSMPYLDQIYQDYLGKDFVFVSVNTEPTNMPSVREFLIEQKLHFPVFVDSGRLQSQLRVNTYPTAILSDKKGVVRSIHIGPTSMVTLRGEIDKLLAE